MKPHQRRLKAFTLTEILVVLAIIGILILLVLPNNAGVMTQARAVEAKMQLKAIHDRQVAYQAQNLTYSSDLEEVGYEAQPTIKEDGGSYYKYSIVESSQTSFKARAEAVVDFDNDGQLNVWEIDQDKKLREVVKD